MKKQTVVTGDGNQVNNGTRRGDMVQGEIRWDDQRGQEPIGSPVFLEADDAAARGLDGIGVPLGPTGLGEPTRDHPDYGKQEPGRRKNGSQSLIQQCQSVENCDIQDQYGLYAFTEDARALCMRLAVIIAMTSGELKADAKRKGQEAGDGHMSWGDKLKLKNTLRKIARKFNSMADHFADAGGDAASAWRLMEQCLDELEASADKPRTKRRGFTIASGK